MPKLVHQILSDYVISVSDLKKNPTQAALDADGNVVAVLNRNQPIFYCVPPDAFTALLRRSEGVKIPRDATSSSELLKATERRLDAVTKAFEEVYESGCLDSKCTEIYRNIMKL